MEKKLGFGMMRMPVADRSDQSTIEFDRVYELADTYIGKGFTYFDTAYTYHKCQAEKAAKKILTDRYDRDRFELATKMPLRVFEDEADLQVKFEEQLRNCGVEYFDRYLMHNVGRSVFERCRSNHVFEFIRKMQEQGKAKQVGMSFHDSPEFLEEILTEYSDCLDFLQLQVNYIDMTAVGVQSAKCLEIAKKYKKPVIVMEPCKGGTLANVTDDVAAIFKAYAPDASPASWALRFAASQEGVERVLSGMNTMEQVRDNTAIFSDFRPLNEEELAVVNKAADVISARTAIACTACEYCTHGCPMNIPIPQYFELFNSAERINTGSSSHKVYYNNMVVGGTAKASDCIGCGSCEQACPQHLTIREYLKEVAGKFES